MPKYDYDLFVIGAGSGGVRASRVAAGYGARVAVAEEKDLGGTCVNVGCIPKKLLVYASHFAEDFEDAAGFGWTVGKRRLDWRALVENKDREIARLNQVYGDLLDKAGAERVEGHAEIVDPHTILVAGRKITTQYILVATGGKPVPPPPVPGADLAVTSNEMFHLDALPRRVLVIGGGYIAVEFAGILHGLGCETTLVHRGPVFLRGFDEDLRTTLADEMRKKGITLHFETTVERIDLHEGARRAMLFDGPTIDADLVLCAIGRIPHSDGIGLERVGVKRNLMGAIEVDEFSRSSVPNIFAVGDVTDRMNLTPIALAEGQAVAQTLFHQRPTKVDYSGVPTAVFSQPPLATVGLTEAEARQKHGDVHIYRSRFRPLKHTLTGRDERTFMKLIVDPASDRVLGCHMVGADSPEIIQCLGIALKAGATKAHFDATIGLHPSAAEEFVTMRTRD